MEAAEGSERHPPVKEEDGTILTQEKGKGWKENGAITRARTAPEDTEDELAPVAAGLLIPHLDEEDGEALVEESTTPLTEEAPVAKFTQISMMEDAEKDLVVEEAADMWLRCPVCRELLFKPAVIACGHIYCLDCLLQAMNIAGVSSCAVCKMTYDHFPSECASIGVLVLKSVKGDINGKRIVGDKVQLSDITCSVCKEILCEPSVLNCGHVFCISCLNVDGDKIKCPSCDAFHCNDHPVVCTYASHFIKACFPEAYESRVQKMQTSSGTHFLGYKGKSQNVKLSHTHVGVGCDCCGVYPIQGDRFTCKTCDNFDLCQKCVKKNISIQGRFGQQHLSDHVLELDDSFLFGTVLDVLNQKNEEDGGEAELPENDREELQLPEWEPGLLRWGWTDEQAPEDDDGPEGLAGEGPLTP